MIDKDLRHTVEDALGLEKDSLGVIAWLYLQDGASGENLKLTDKEVDAIEALCGGQGQVEKAVKIVKAYKELYAKKGRHGWDEVEALALEKAIRNLNAMRSDGDLREMAALAKMASDAKQNAAKNAGTGESAPTLAIGNLGVMKLTLTQEIVNQLQDNTNEKAQSREMLDLTSTRKLTGSAKQDEQYSNKPESLGELLDASSS